MIAWDEYQKDMGAGFESVKARTKQKRLSRGELRNRKCKQRECGALPPSGLCRRHFPNVWHRYKHDLATGRVEDHKTFQEWLDGPRIYRKGNGDYIFEPRQDRVPLTREELIILRQLNFLRLIHGPIGTRPLTQDSPEFVSYLECVTIN